MYEANVWFELILDGASVCTVYKQSSMYVHRFLFICEGADRFFYCTRIAIACVLPSRIFIIAVGNGNEVCQGHIIWQCGFFIRRNVMSKIMRRNDRTERTNRSASFQPLQVRAPCVVVMYFFYLLLLLLLRPYPFQFDILSGFTKPLQSTCSCPFSSSQLENNQIKCIQHSLSAVCYGANARKCWSVVVVVVVHPLCETTFTYKFFEHIYAMK